MNADYRTRAELLAGGHTRRSLRRAVVAGELVHVRRDRYLDAGLHDDIVRAVRVGGRLTCVSLLHALGIFVLFNRMLHVQVEPTAGRLRSPHTKRVKLSSMRKRGARVHWSHAPETATQSCVVSLVQALAQAVVCQTPRGAIATLDSALNLRMIDLDGLADVFELLPPRLRVLREFVDGVAESGPETLVRLMARRLGCTIRLQQRFKGVGRVDLVLDGWLVVECDSRQFHSSWEAQEADRLRDLRLAQLGFCTLRLTASAIMYDEDEVFAALRGLILSRRAATG